MLKFMPETILGSLTFRGVVIPCTRKFNARLMEVYLDGKPHQTLDSGY